MTAARCSGAQVEVYNETIRDLLAEPRSKAELSAPGKFRRALSPSRCGPAPLVIAHASTRAIGASASETSGAPYAICTCGRTATL